MGRHSSRKLHSAGNDVLRGAAADGADVEGGVGRVEEIVPLCGEVCREVLDGLEETGCIVDRGSSLLRVSAVCLGSEDCNLAEAVSLAGACGMQRGRFADDQGSGAQSVFRDQAMRAETANLFVGGQHDAHRGGQGGGSGLACRGQEAGEEAFDIAGATTIEHPFMDKGGERGGPVGGGRNGIGMTEEGEIDVDSLRGLVREARRSG